MMAAVSDTFVARAVASDEEIVAWGELCARGFSHRPGDPARFLRRWQADPTGRREGIRIVVDGANQPVGSVRVFDRTLDVEGGSVAVAGLGEVCTDPACRGKGVASILLPDAVEYCETRSGASVALLHAAAGVRGLYVKYGFGSDLCVPYRRLPLVPLTAAATTTTPLPSTPPHSPPAGRAGCPCACCHGCGDALPVGLRSRAVPRLGDEWRGLAPLHTPFMRALGACGFVARLPEEGYWGRWLPNSAGGAYHVLEREGPGGGGAGAGPPLAYAAVLRRPEGLKLADFAVALDAHGGPAVPADALVAVIRRAAAACDAAAPAPGGGGAATSLLVPQLLLRWLHRAGAGASAEGCACAGAGADGPPQEDCDDLGWMLRPLLTGSAVSTEPAAAADGAPGRGACPAAVAALLAASHRGAFLVWLVDSF